LQPIVIRFGRLGDMVMTTAVLHLLHRRFSSPCTVLGAGAWNLQLYRGHPDVGRVWTFARHFPFMLGAAWWRARRELRRSHPGPIYVLERQPRQLARIRRMLALSRIDPARCVFATDESSYDGEHWVDHYVRIAQRMPPALNAADYPVSQPARKSTPRLRVLQSERDAIEVWLQARGWTGQKLVLIQAGNFRSMSRRREEWQRSAADDKAWPVENWASLVQKIRASAPDMLIVLCGAPTEADMLRRIRLSSGPHSVLTADVSLRSLLALCEVAHSMISIDTGPAHAAAALGVPLVVMYGAESPGRWLPRSPSGSAVTAVGGPPTSTRVDQIAVHDVFNAWCALYGAATRTPASKVLDERVACDSVADLELPVTRYAS
jgi:ADP-heptose:LPS heptosyltransferase